MIEEFSGFFRQLKYFNDQEQLICPNNRVFAGVSGGVDSVVLLHYLCWLRERQPLELEVMHFNHHLRPSAEQEAQFVMCLCDKYRINGCIVDLDVQGEAARRKRGVEEAARYLRRKYWQENIDAATQLVATGHHRDDLAETVLINLTRGCGLDGLTSLTPRNGFYVRPLLSVSRQQIVTFAKTNDLTWCEDESNLSNNFLRNRLRHQLLPLWQELAGYDVRQQIADLALNLVDDRDYLGEKAQEILEKVRTDNPCVIKISYLRELAPALRQRVIKLFLQEQGLADLQVKHFQTIDDIIIKNSQAKTCHLPGKWIIERHKNKLCIERASWN